MPTTPQKAAGWRMEPPVSLPNAPAARPPATAAADPPDDPPGTRLRSHGLRVGPKAECSVDEPIANSSRLVLPTTTAPASMSRCTAVAVYGERYSASIRLPAVVLPHARHMLSLSAIGTPASGSFSPAAMR